MLHLNSPQLAQKWCQNQRDEGKSIGFVATMGALHDGHLKLVRRAVKENDLAIASIFVNPLQFNKAEDLNNYPNRQEEDFSALKANDCQMVFTGEIADFFPEPGGLSSISIPSAGQYAEGLEGAFRPGHLEGSREIVSRLFSAIGPCRTYFGEKDYQQAHVIQALAATLQDITVIICPTSREDSGLAMSSRNLRLSKDGKALAVRIYRALTAAKTSWEKGERSVNQLQKSMIKTLSHPAIKLEYAELRDPNHWTATTPTGQLNDAQALIAAEIEGIRLIDNMLISHSPSS